MNTTMIAIVFGTIYCLEQFGIGWYGWRNPRPKLNIVRKIPSALMLFSSLYSAYQVATMDTVNIDQFIASFVMSLYVVGNCAMVVILGAVLFIVRKKYFQRVGEINQPSLG